MTIINPDARTPTGSRTLSRTLTLLPPTRDDLVDAAFGLTLGVVILLGLATTYSSSRYLIVGVVGLVGGIVVGHLANALRLPWWAGVGGAAVVYYALGGAIALREDVLIGFVPSLRTLAELSTLAVGGWKDLLTTLPPVEGDGPYLVLVWLLTLAAGTLGHLLSRRVRAPWAAVVVPVAMLAIVIAVGTFEGAFPVVVGIGVAVGVFGWLFVRFARRARIGNTGLGSTTRWVSGVALLAVAAASGWALSTLLPGPHQIPRHVLRTYVQPPEDINKYPSPLAGFRKYSSDSQRLYEVPLLKVEGAAEGTLVRMAVLDSYSGTVWSASGGMAGDPRAGFRRIGSIIPGAPEGATDTMRITVLPGYATTSDLNAWLPATGPATDIVFAGANEREHRAYVRYNIGTGQGLLPDRLKADDVIQVTSVALPTDVGGLPRPGGPVLVDDATTTFLQPIIESLGAGAGDQWSRAVAIAQAMRERGSWSNGTRQGEQMYLPGHGVGRLMVFATDLVGSDEHYAATYALILNRLGYPARVVLGASVGADEIVRGRDVKAWVEVSLDGPGWVTIPTEAFTPSRDKQPNTVPPKKLDQNPAVNVPPPAPVRPPGSFDSLFNTGAPGDQLDKPSFLVDLWGVIVAVLSVIGPPLTVIGAIVGGILGAKALRRRHRRRTGRPTTQVAAGWLEFVDRARDLGAVVPARATRLEQAAAIGGEDASALAGAANRVVFGRGEPDADTSAGYWGEVMTSHAALVAGLPRWKRWAIALNPRSLVPLARDRRAVGPHQPLRRRP